MLDLKAEHPDAKVLVHPECNHKIIEIADLSDRQAELSILPGRAATKNLSLARSAVFLQN